MMALRFMVSACMAGVIASGIGAALSQDYPTKPVRILTSEAGGGNDVVARLIAQGISGPLGQQVIVENRPDVLGAEIESKSPPDAYTLLFASGSLWIAPLIQKMQYDMARDFSPIILATRSPLILVVHPALPAKTVGELIALAKLKPGSLNYASSGTGGNPHLAAELFKSMAGVNIVRVSYKGGGPAVNALAAGEVEMMFVTASSGAAHIKSGRVRPLAVANAQPSALLPDLPTVAASGVPGYESTQMSGFFAPAHTPSARVDQLNHEIANVLGRSETRDKLANLGLEPVAGSAQQFASAIAADTATNAKVIRDAGIRAE
jgi:tripartite-type tricarboxylate transporter receptor subunit TctC